MPRLIPHVIDLGGSVKRLVRLPDFYESGAGAAASNVGTAVGISRATDTDRTLELVTISQLVTTGRAAYLTIRHGTGRDARSSKILCSKDKLDTAAQMVVEKTYRGRTVQSAGYSRRRKRG
jgi:hypothetical protein